MKAKIAGLIAGKLTDDLTAQWMSPRGTPTRHLVVDNLLPDSLARDIYNAFPTAGWNPRDTFRERKKTFSKVDRYPLVAAITDGFHTDEVLAAVKRVTQIDALEADPSLYAGGISMMERGDFLNPHIDNSHDGARQRYRRLNLLYYISPDWREEFGGNLELWDDSVRAPVVLHSRFNRLIIMETNRHSWHSVSPVSVDSKRCCVSNYYFSQGSPQAHDYYHVTSFLGRPGQPGLRAFSRVDNALRQMVAVVTKRSRGKSLSRY